MKKTAGERFKQKGYKPNLPVLILPGLCSSCLKVVESPYKEWNDRRIWLDITTIGFGKVWDQIGLRKAKKKPPPPPPKKLTISNPTTATSFRVLSDVYKDQFISIVDMNNVVDDEEEKKAEDLDIDQDKKRRWIAHMVLQSDGITDPPGIKLRPLEGIRGVMYLDPGAITNSLSYVFGPLVETFWEIGYTDANIRAAPYDWRVPPFRLEERDQYFTKLTELIEDMVNVNKKKIVILAHSLGTRLTHYFLRRVNHIKGRQWISDHIHTWVAIGPLFLGAPKSVRAITSGERMGLDAFLFEHEGLDLSRLCGSSAWMFPYVVEDFEFQNYVYKLNSNNQWIPQSIKDTLHESSVPHLWDNYVKYYHQDPYFGTQDDMLKPPPVDRLFAIYGINLRTEAFYFYKKSNNGISALELDSRGEMSNYDCQGGIAFETKDTRQNKLKGRKRGGDGTVPYPSLSYCTNWSNDINVIIEELEGAEHREILKDKSFTSIVVEYCSTAPPPPKLPETFRELRYDVKEIRGNKRANRSLVFTRKAVKLYRANGQAVFKKKYAQINLIQPYTNEQVICLDIQNMPRQFFHTEKYQEISQELVVRMKFIEYSRFKVEDPRDEHGQTELHRAVLANDISSVRELISDDRDINAQDKNDWTPLHCATYKRFLDIALILLKNNKIDTSLLTKDGTNAFHYLVRPGPDEEPLEDVLESMLETGLNINIQSRGGATPLHHAAMYGSIRSARWLIAKFANVNAMSETGETPLHIAIYQNNREMIELLLTNGADKHVISSKGKSPLACAQSISLELFNFVKDFRVAGFRARALYAYSGIPVKELNFKEGDRINQIRIDDSYGNGWWFGECNGVTGYFPSNYVKVSEVIQDGNRPPLGSPEPEDSSVDTRDEYGQTPLHKAAYEDRCEDVFRLIFERANVNAVDRNGWTPFHCAASKGNVEVMLILQQQPGIKLAIRSADGTTALHYLVRNQYDVSVQPKILKILERFLTLSVDIDILGKYDETPLHQAVMRNNEFTVKFLLENGANVNATSDTNTTPLFYAVGTKSLKLVELLLKYGADPTIKGKRGSPLDAAKGNDVIYNLLLNHAGDRQEVLTNRVEPPPIPARRSGISLESIQRRVAPKRPSMGTNRFALNRLSSHAKINDEEDFEEFNPALLSPRHSQVVVDPISNFVQTEFSDNLEIFEQEVLNYLLRTKYNDDKNEFSKKLDTLFPRSVPTPAPRNIIVTTQEVPEKGSKSSFFKKKKDKKKDK